ncbi:hypothetical protein Y032_0110g171 [Ancylostoma ceylanicum]|uniref:Uncharacterized protein n=1 Tax=Ancylostoma ceylanicum TaxID=53326 RepID=A0A016TEP3_9BILA|nr:hypothetical protein Y032_0110g171 [Ancylostoma ceylanicum]
MIKAMSGWEWERDREVHESSENAVSVSVSMSVVMWWRSGGRGQLDAAADAATPPRGSTELTPPRASRGEESAENSDLLGHIHRDTYTVKVHSQPHADGQPSLGFSCCG